ncbi:MAG: hypothetical protein CMI32_02545 [Opitutales bacterium]|nr:hypothetical protein [Opitutales bacterium]|tara:strand:- start:225 stop:518 length:294 start_codon:yes stop_codon:yes gene_type:complete
MSDPKPDIMDGCGVSFWVIASLILLLLIPVSIRQCSDFEDEAPVGELERIQRIRKIEEAASAERALQQQLNISLEEAMQRVLSKVGDANATGKENNP